MCGITGLLDRNIRPTGTDLSVVADAMARTLSSRGPDDHAVWADREAGIALGHRRLAIVDLSPAGAQPMVTANGRCVIAYNGEMYNTGEVRAELEAAGHRFRGHSDTEVLVEACGQWGVAAAVARFNGIFAFALWDRADRTLWLVRDRLGVKPLYWAWIDGRLLFGSEMKALAAHPHWRPELDRDALAAYFRHCYLPAPHTVYRGVSKLMPGSILRLAPDDAEPRIERYWDMRSVARNGLANRLALDDATAIDRLDSLLLDAVGRQMVSDVPLGVFLSGGVDSSTVVALMQANSSRPVKTFTIGFHEARYDEAAQAKAVAAHLGTDHTELYVDSRQALDVIPSLPDWFDEPFADASQIPTCLLSALTRRSVTVALSGDGGDELFAGYSRYLWAERIWKAVGGLPTPMRRGLAGAMRGVPVSSWDRLAGVIPAGRRPWLAGDKMHKLAGVIARDSRDDLYRGLLTLWDSPERLVLGATEPRGVLWDDAVRDEVPDFTERMQLLDTLTYLPDDILVKIDRASMATSLEARVPLLDHRVVEFAWRLPPSVKIRNGTSKWLLRQVLYRHVPQALIDRPKMGFGVPIDDWLRGPLRDWAETLLSEDRLRTEGILDPAPIRRKWTEHLSGRRNWQYQLWTVLMFQAWHERWHGDRARHPAPMAAPQRVAAS